LSNMPQAYTYGYTTYQKGADVISTLRSYLGDSNFFNGLKYYLTAHSFQAVNADTLMYSLQRYSGMGLTNFFNNWVFAPGWAHFSVDSMTSVPSGPNYKVTAYIRQRLTGTSTYYTNVPLSVTFKSSSWNTYKTSILASGHLGTYTFTVPFNPVFAAINIDEKISEAIAPDTLIVSKTGTYNMTNSRFDLTVTSITDSAFLYFEHNYTAPDPVKNISLHDRISPNRFWKFSGIFPANFKATAKLYYDGRKITNGGAGYLDTALTIYTRDSIILLYRPNVTTDWKEFPGYTKHNIGANSNMEGYMQLDSVPPGEYTFANGKSSVLGINQPVVQMEIMKIFPNPASDNFTVQFAPAAKEEQVCIYDMQGKMIQQMKVSQGQKNCLFKTTGWPNGTYLVSLRSNNEELATQQIIISR
ncbi:MAG TPA: T9SS type A sorting domain-containing protein, partial [Bacteroidia bacterium]|nr:T9SS type A sorting domain-containing protein [Bacteroidia bacterium]